MTILCRTNICLSNYRFDSSIKRGCSSNAERRHKKKLKMQITCTYTVIDCVNFVLVDKYLYYRYLIFNCICLENQLGVRSGIQMLKWLHLCGELFVHTSEIRGLCLIEWPSEMLQKFLYDWNMKTHQILPKFVQNMKINIDLGQSLG